MTWLSHLLSPAVFLPRRRLGNFVAYLTIAESGVDDLEITEHPVQQGAAITDHAYKKSPSLSLALQFSQGDTFTPLDETYRALLELQESREPFNVITGKRSYKDMLFKSLRVTTDKNSDNILSVQAELRQIKIVQVTLTSVPPRDKQSNPGSTGATQRAGTKKAQEVKPQDQAQSESILSKIGGFGS